MVAIEQVSLSAPAVRTRRRWLLGGAAIAVAACGAEPTPSPAEHTASRDMQLAARASAGRTITLVTGDRVTLPDRPNAMPEVEPGAGRAHVGYSTVRRGDDVFVIPRDVGALIANGSVDRALFNVSRLLADGFSDAQTTDLPLLLTGESRAVAAGIARSALVVDRVMPVLRVAAVRQPKATPGAALETLRAATSLATSRSSRASRAGDDPAPALRLDRRLKRSLDHSVPQIGAPAAHARGLTGEGVTVAVIDSGVDKSHPDLAGKVIAAETFIDDGLGTEDVAGHGTHVASIIAGSGAASGGLYRGVAPGARLISARACGELFCSESSVLAALEWAVVEQHAQILNVSLGAPDLPGVDPLEEAVNRLSQDYGALIVIAAGNFAEEGFPVDSPASAEASLAVGAVDHDGALAAFSARGPTVDGRVIKPDLTAPGVGIVAALASGVPPIGTPVGTAYQALSGTSMAAPHAAGAAALVLQQHPGWTGAQVKAALIGAADPDPGLGVDPQGAGRLDVDRATRQQLAAQPPSFDPGLAVWPHSDDPLVTQTLTYHNTAGAPVALALAARLSLPDGTAGPGAVVRIEPASLTIPAGGSASATLTIDTRGTGADVRYAGSVIATGDGLRVITPIGVTREVESHELTIQALDREGAPTFQLITLASRNPTGLFGFLSVDGTLQLRLPRDRYSLYSNADDVFMAHPGLMLDRASTVMFDHRAARPVIPSVSGVPLVVNETRAVVWDKPANLAVGGRAAGSPLSTAHVGPALPDREFRSWVVVSAEPSGGGIFLPPAGSPLFPGVVDRYALAHQEQGRLLTGWQTAIHRRQLATVKSSAAGTPPSAFRKFLAVVPAGEPEAPFADAFPGDYAPNVDRTEHLYGPGLAWVGDSRQMEQWPGQDFFFAVDNHSSYREYRPGRAYVERYNQPPFGPSLAILGGTDAATRLGDTLTIAPSMYSDRALPSISNWSAAFSTRYALFRNEELLFEDTLFPFFPPPLQVPPSAATYRFESVQERGPNLITGEPLFSLSTLVTASWTFRSAHVPGSDAQLLSLPTLRFVPELDGDGRPSSSVMVLPAVVERPPGAATPRITDVNVEVSFDDGARWSRVPGALIGDRWFGIVVNPAGAEFASLRGTARDALGQRGDVSIIRVYRIAKK